MAQADSNPRADEDSLVWFPAPSGRTGDERGDIVIVDDSVSNLKIYTQIASLLGPHIVVNAFMDPRAALDWLGSHEADLVISDYKMPAMDGAAFTSAIRELPSCADVPVVIVTAYTDKSFRLNALQSGATDFLGSPVDYLEFQTRTRNLMRLGRHQRLMRARATRLASKLQETEHSRDRILRDSRERLAQVIDAVPAMISATDTAGAPILVNAYAAAVLGEGGRGKSAAEADLAQTSLVLASGKALDAYEERLVDAAGEERVFLTLKSPLRDSDGQLEGVVTTSLDITERKRVEAEMRFLAQHDHLTALANRAQLYHRLQQECEQRRGSEALFALHFIDLDRFKYINDGLGHSFGNRFLQEVGRRLQATAGANDVVARVGGDEFAILELHPAGEAGARALAQRINRSLLDPFVVGEHKIAASASIGVALYPRDGDTPESLMQNADLAMYRVKTTQHSGFCLFTNDMKAEIQKKLMLQNNLRSALENDDLVLFYQPIFDIRTGAVAGAEALLRWRTEDGALLPPDEFIPLAKETGIILEIDRIALDKACRQANIWNIIAPKPVRVFVNVSFQHTSAVNIAHMVAAALAASGLSPALLGIELTEDMLIEDSHPAVRDLGSLRRSGVEIAIDDFGTGRSSLARLSTLPIDRIKIDRSFLDGLASASSRAVLSAIVALGRALDLFVVAEGVETTEQLEEAKRAGCDAVQGNYLSPPMEAAQFEEFLMEQRAGLSIG